jgi:hypothetical protein
MSATAEVGDTVLIPSGSHCPYVISRTDQTAAATGSDRPSHVPPEATHAKKNDGWELLGEAYVHSIMDGELELGRSSAEVLRHRLV